MAMTLRELILDSVMADCDADAKHAPDDPDGREMGDTADGEGAPNTGA